MSSQPPNPFSREGSGPEDGLGAPGSGGSANPWPGSAGSGSEWPGSAGSPPAGGSAGSAGEWPVAGSGSGSPTGSGTGSSSGPSANPYSAGSPPANPYSAGSPQSATPWPAYPGSPEPTIPYGGSAPYPNSAGSAPGFDAQPTPPYGSGSGSYGTPYSTGSPYSASSYGDNPYEAAPYQASYGSYSPYGVPAVAHPQATLSLILGIVGVAACSLVGIAALVLGNKARKEIDAQPGRYSGRGMATAGFVLGIISVGISVMWVLIFAIGIASGGASS